MELRNPQRERVLNADDFCRSKPDISDEHVDCVAGRPAECKDKARPQLQRILKGNALLIEPGFDIDIQVREVVEVSRGLWKVLHNAIWMGSICYAKAESGVRIRFGTEPTSNVWAFRQIDDAVKILTVHVAITVNLNQASRQFVVG
jgi:hypothetical protein